MTTDSRTIPIPEHCNACGKTLLLSNLFVDDGCPCNSLRGVNFPTQPCAICKVENCVKPAHRLALLYGYELAEPLVGSAYRRMYISAIEREQRVRDALGIPREEATDDAANRIADRMGNGLLPSAARELLNAIQAVPLDARYVGMKACRRIEAAEKGVADALGVEPLSSDRQFGVDDRGFAGPDDGPVFGGPPIANRASITPMSNDSGFDTANANGPSITPPTAKGKDAGVFTLQLTITLEQEEDGRIIADIPGLPGVVAYGDSEAEARLKVNELADRVIRERLRMADALPAETVAGYPVWREEHLGDPAVRRRIVSDANIGIRTRIGWDARTPQGLPDCSYLGGNEDPSKCNSTKCPRHGLATPQAPTKTDERDTDAWRSLQFLQIRDALQEDGTVPASDSVAAAVRGLLRDRRKLDSTGDRLVRERDALTMLAAVVRKAGGRVLLSDRDLVDAFGLTLHRTDPVSGGLEFHIKGEACTAEEVNHHESLSSPLDAATGIRPALGRDAMGEVAAPKVVAEKDGGAARGDSGPDSGSGTQTDADRSRPRSVAAVAEGSRARGDADRNNNPAPVMASGTVLRLGDFSFDARATSGSIDRHNEQIASLQRAVASLERNEAPPDLGECTHPPENWFGIDGETRCGLCNVVLRVGRR